MSESSVRDLIARALRESFMPEIQGEVGAGWYRHADAVLAVLADLPDDVIEDAARGYMEIGFSCPCESCLDMSREHVQGVFKAAFGGEQA